MSLVLKMNKADWLPSASISVLKQRAELIDKIRTFFKKKEVLEVDVPLLSQGVALDVGLNAFELIMLKNEARYFLQTSPEFAMKRLLAAGSGPIFYLGKACRQGEVGRYHNAEFTMLEWYRPDYDAERLIDETIALINTVLPNLKSQRVTYAELFETHFKLNPHRASIDELINIARNQPYQIPELPLDSINPWLDLLFSHSIEPYLGHSGSVVVTQFPASQAALAQTFKNEDGFEVANRFEFYIKGIEIANGYQELQCAQTLNQRFVHDNKVRTRHHLKPLPIDERLLNAMKQGLPACSGIALGIDRLIMLALDKTHINEVIAFNFNHA